MITEDYTQYDIYHVGLEYADYSARLRGMYNVIDQLFYSKINNSEINPSEINKCIEFVKDEIDTAKLMVEELESC